MIKRIETTINSAELDRKFDGRNQDIIRVVVTNEKGERAVGFLAASIQNGRVQFELTTKKNRGKETIKTAVADWVL